MKLLLDTHALLWWLNDDEHLGQVARDLIADPSNDVLVSTVSLWEVVVKVRIGKLEADIAEISKAIQRDGFTLLTVSSAHLIMLADLPYHKDHRDPFDHLLVAQAICEGTAVLSQDRQFQRYPMQVLKCTDPHVPGVPR